MLALQPKWLFFLPQAIRLSLEQSLPPEPKEESTESVSKLRIRTPSGEFFERRFLASSKLQVVFDFVASKGYPWEEYKLLGTFPRRDVSKYLSGVNTTASCCCGLGGLVCYSTEGKRCAWVCLSAAEL